MMNELLNKTKEDNMKKVKGFDGLYVIIPDRARRVNRVEGENRLIDRYSYLIEQVTDYLNAQGVFKRNVNFPKATKLRIAKYAEEMGSDEFTRRLLLASDYVKEYEVVDNLNSEEFWSRTDGGYLLRELNRYYNMALDYGLEVDEVKSSLE